MTTQVKITGVAYNAYGQIMPVGSVQSLDDSFAASLISSGRAVPSFAFPATPNTPFAQTTPVTDAVAALLSNQITSSVSGWKIGLGPGASRDARNHVEYVCAVGDYSRKNGVVTAVLTNATPPRWFPGKVIQFRAQNAPEVEGTFNILSCVVTPGVSCALTWADARADSAGDPSVFMVIADVAAWSLCNSYLSTANLCTGGKCDFWVGATGSTNAFDWTNDRIYNRLTKFGDPTLGQTLFDVIVWPGGASGNNFIRAYNGNALALQDTFTALTARLEQQIVHLLKYTRFLVVKIEAGSRNLDPSSTGFTLASLVVNWYYNVILQKYRCVYIAPSDGLLASNYQDPTLPLDSDIANNAPPYEWLFDDGTHFNYAGQQRDGIALGFMLNKILGQITPDLGTMAIGRPENLLAEPGGSFSPTVNTGRFGNAALKGSPDVGSGSQPTNTTVAVANPGAASLVQSVEADPEGGWNWKLQVTDASGSAQGVTLTAALQSPGGDTWVNILNDSRNQGKRIKGLLPFDINWTNEASVKTTTIGLFGTVGGNEYLLGSMLSDEGSYGMGGSAKQALTRGQHRLGRHGLHPGRHAEHFRRHEHADGPDSRHPGCCGRHHALQGADPGLVHLGSVQQRVCDGRNGLRSHVQSQLAGYLPLDGLGLQRQPDLPEGCRDPNGRDVHRGRASHHRDLCPEHGNRCLDGQGAVWRAPRLHRPHSRLLRIDHEPGFRSIPRGCPGALARRLGAVRGAVRPAALWPERGQVRHTRSGSRSLGAHQPARRLEADGRRPCPDRQPSRRSPGHVRGGRNHAQPHAPGRSHQLPGLDGHCDGFRAAASDAASPPAPGHPEQGWSPAAREDQRISRGLDGHLPGSSALRHSGHER
jgi:hypothetical protein